MAPAFTTRHVSGSLGSAAVPVSAVLVAPPLGKD